MLTLFLAHPVTACITCASKLSIHKKPTTVICYTCTGPMPAVKITLRCDRCGTNYIQVKLHKVLPCALDSKILIIRPHGFFVRHDQYGCEELGGYRYHADFVRQFVCASQLCYMYVKRLCYENRCTLG